MSKHTPGPWKVLENPDGLPIIVGPGEWTDIAHIRGIMLMGEEITANAHLIAAAPDLWEALVDLCALVAMLSSSDHPLVHKAQAAIGKAEGRANT